MSFEDLPDLLTVKEVAKLFKLSPLTIKRWEKRKKLFPIRINTRGDRRYRKTEIIAMIEKM